MPIEKLQMVRLATVAILALVLAAGFLLGAVWDRRLDAESTPAAGESEVFQARERGGRRTPIYVRVAPPLSAEQLAAAEVIVARRREAARALVREARIDSLYGAMKSAERAFKELYDPRFAALVDSSRNAIKLVMTPEQSVQYDSLLADNDRRRNAEARGGRR